MSTTFLPLNRIVYPQEKNISSNYTLQSTDALILVNASKNDVTIFLPPVQSITHNRPFTIKRVDEVMDFTVTLLPTNHELFDDGLFYILEGAVTIGTDDVNWVSIASRVPISTATLVNLGSAARGIQTIKVDKLIDSTTVQILRGSIHISDGTSENIYSLATDLHKVIDPTDISDCWYAVYVDPPSSGVTLTDSMITFSQIMPIFSSSRYGWFKPLTSDIRCIGFVRGVVGETKYLSPFAFDGNIQLSSGDPIAIDISNAIPSSEWTEYTISSPLAETYAIGYLLASYFDASSSLKYRNSELDSTDGRSIAFVSENSQSSSGSIQLETNDLNAIQLKWDTTTSNTINFYTIGFVLPDYIYTRPAGGIYRQIDEIIRISDETLSLGPEVYGLQTIRIKQINDSTVRALPGSIHIHDTNEGIYHLDLPFDITCEDLSANTWYALYIVPTDDSADITEINYTSVMPIEDQSYMGYYHPDSTNNRCIGFIYSDANSKIIEFNTNGYKYTFSSQSNRYLINESFDTSQHTVTSPSPLGGMSVYQEVYTLSSNTFFYLRTKGSSETGRPCGVQSNSYTQFSAVTNDDKQFEVKFGSDTSAVFIDLIGFDLPDFIYTGPAGGIINGGGSALIDMVDVTSDYTMNGDEGLINAFGTLTIILPDAFAFNKVIRIANRGQGMVTIQRRGSDTIEGNISIQLAFQYATVELVSDKQSLWFEF